MLIQKLRLQRGWSQEQLAEVSGLSVRTVQRLERGQTGSLESLNALAAVFETDISRLTEPDMEQPNTATLRADEALALAQVRKIKRFYVHLAQYAVIMPFLALINLFSTPGYWWVIWPALGWGLGLAAHAASVFDLFPFLNGDWEKREVEKRLGREL